MIPFIWTDQCQNVFIRISILVYPDLNKLHALFMIASKYVWPVVLTQEHVSMIEGSQHPFMYVSRLFQDGQLNFATWLNEAYAIYMAVKCSPSI